MSDEHMKLFETQLIVKILNSLDEIDFVLDNTEGDILGDENEYLIARFTTGAYSLVPVNVRENNKDQLQCFYKSANSSAAVSLGPNHPQKLKVQRNLSLRNENRYSDLH